jgi:hypothetical protein
MQTLSEGFRRMMAARSAAARLDRPTAAPSRDTGAFRRRFVRVLATLAGDASNECNASDERGAGRSLGEVNRGTNGVHVPTESCAIPAGTMVMLGAVMPPSEAMAAAQQVFGAFASKGMAEHHRMHCEAGELIAQRLGLGPAVVGGLTHTYERWDGRSSQQLAHGEGVSLPMRVVQVAYQAGQDSISRVAAEIGERVLLRGGKQLDPNFAKLFAEDPEHFLEGLDELDLNQAVVDAEPGEPIWLSGDEIENALTAIADFGDLKSPHMIGHSRRVASVATAAARAASLPASDTAQLGRAGLIHDIGRIGVRSRLLSKSGRLTKAEHERIRMHSYFTERILLTIRCWLRSPRWVVLITNDSTGPDIIVVSPRQHFRLRHVFSLRRTRGARSPRRGLIASR